MWIGERGELHVMHAPLWPSLGPVLRHRLAALPLRELRVIRQALTGAPITVTGDGTQTRSICYVDDTVAGILAMARDDFAGPVNIGNP